jgi:hypothetical protein
MEIWQDGVCYEWARRGDPNNEYCIIDGILKRATGNGSWRVDIFRPKPKRHTFGGVVFEETGEVRCAKHMDWWYFPISDFSDSASPRYGYTNSEVNILRPVAIEEER